jgi:hypothetical protein
MFNGTNPSGDVLLTGLEMMKGLNEHARLPPPICLDSHWSGLVRGRNRGAVGKLR